MMTPREQTIETLSFGRPDKIPFTPGGGRQSTLDAWHAQGLPEGVYPTIYLAEILGLDLPNVPAVHPEVDFRMIPQFEEKILEHRDGHYVVQDWKGNVCEIADDFDCSYLRNAIDFVTRRWIRCPVENRDDWEQMKQRYSLDTPGRFGDQFLQQAEQARSRECFLEYTFPGPFWQLREWCGFEGLCMMMIEEPELVNEMAEFWRTFIHDLLARMFEHVVPDSIHINEDMAYKAKAMISPTMAREFCTPSWRDWNDLARAAGVPIVAVDSDGYIGELIPLWIEAGVNVCDPIEVAAHCDINAFRDRFGHDIAYRGGVDKRCMAKGGKALREEMKRIEPVLRDGGYIPSCDHGVPPDVSWPNFVDYARQLAEMTGWL